MNSDQILAYGFALGRDVSLRIIKNSRVVVCSCVFIQYVESITKLPQWLPHPSNRLHSTFMLHRKKDFLTKYNMHAQRDRFSPIH